MKRILFLAALLAVLFVLSSCVSSSRHEELTAQYNELNEKYDDARSQISDLRSLLSRIDESYATAYCFYDHADPDVTEEEGHAALLQIGDYLRDAGY